MTETPAGSPVIQLEGHYQGKNLYVQNPFAPDGTSFCAYEVRVNGAITADVIRASAFEIDLKAFRFKIGDKVSVQIFHQNACTPKVINPEVLKPRAVFTVTAINADPDSETLTWTSTGESGPLPYAVELFRWNKWVKVDEVPGIGTPEAHTYTCRVRPVSGTNKLRVKQTEYTGASKTSPAVSFVSQKPAVTFSYDQADQTITFSAKTDWEIYDRYGSIVRKGHGIKISVANMAKGGYYLCYDNTAGEFRVQ